MSSHSAEQVAIIGAGLSGLTLALALRQKHIPCTIYESRPDAPLNIGGAVMLSPNALRILDTLGIYARIKPRGYSFTWLDYRDASAYTAHPPPTAGSGTGADCPVTEIQEFGGVAKYGYDAMRIYRTELIDELLAALAEQKIPVHYGKKFTHVVPNDNGSTVNFAFADGTTESASWLVGADGIHSTVRRHLYPDVSPSFTGMCGITASVPTAQLQVPSSPDDKDFLHMPVIFVNAKAGSAFVIAPQQPDGSEVLIGKQRRLAPGPSGGLSHAEFKAFFADKESLVAFLQAGNDGFPDVTRRAASNIKHDSINVWPFYLVPRLDAWARVADRVVILGDAAHAIPPSAGQGINQALEDVYMFALLLGAEDPSGGGGAKAVWRGEGELMADALAFWQKYRQARVDQVIQLNKQIDLRRVPDNQGGNKEDLQKLDFDLAWLFKVNLDQVVQDWLDSRKEKGA